MEKLRRRIQILKIFPNHVDANNNLGIVFKQLKEMQKAISCYQRAIQINPDYAIAHNNLGAAFKQIGELQKAISCYQIAIQINPE